MSQILESFFEVSMVGDLHIVEFQPCPLNLTVITSHQFPGAPLTCRLTTPPQFPGAPKRIVILLPHLRIRCWVLDPVSPVSLCFLKPNSDSTLDSPGCSKHPNLSKRFALRSEGSLTPYSLVLVSPLPKLLRSCFPELSGT